MLRCRFIAGKRAEEAAAKKNRRRKQAAVIAGSAAAAVAAAWTLWADTAVMIHEMTVKKDRIPQSFSGLRITQISDFHNSVCGEKKEKLIRLVKKSAPDLIFITGDLIDSRHTDTETAADFIERIVSEAPVYYVPGNHESRIPDAYRELKKSMKASGVHILQHEAEYIEKDGEKIQIIGVNDPDFHADRHGSGGISRKSGLKEEILSREQQRAQNAACIFEEVSRLRDEEFFTVLLSHRPELFETYVRCGIDFVFSGHAHGGQFRLPLAGGLFAPGQGFFPAYDGGLYERKETSMIVSRGIGSSVIPLRFNNRPEIVAAEIIRSRKSHDR